MVKSLIVRVFFMEKLFIHHAQYAKCFQLKRADSSRGAWAVVRSPTPGFLLLPTHVPASQVLFFTTLGWPRESCGSRG